MHVWPAAAGAITLVAAAVLVFEGGALTRMVAPVPYAMSLETGEGEPRRDAYVEVVVVPGSHSVTWDALEETSAAITAFLTT